MEHLSSIKLTSEEADILYGVVKSNITIQELISDIIQEMNFEIYMDPNGIELNNFIGKDYKSYIELVKKIRDKVFEVNNLSYPLIISVNKHNIDIFNEEEYKQIFNFSGDCKLNFILSQESLEYLFLHTDMKDRLAPLIKPKNGGYCNIL